MSDLKIRDLRDLAGRIAVVEHLDTNDWHPEDRAVYEGLRPWRTIPEFPEPGRLPSSWYLERVEGPWEALGGHEVRHAIYMRWGEWLRNLEKIESLAHHYSLPLVVAALRKAAWEVERFVGFLRLPFGALHLWATKAPSR
jgi:hypothetical protein